MKYQAMVLMIPDNVTKTFVLNERFHSSHQKNIIFETKVNHVIEWPVTDSYMVQISIGK